MKKITWGMIGCGDVTEVKNGPGLYLAENSQLKGVWNRTRQKAKDWTLSHQQGIVYNSVDDLLSDEEIDIVYIAVTPDKHKDFALMCAQANKHCLIEKPLAMSYQEGLEIQQAFLNCGKKAYVAFYRRAMNRFLFIREIIESGKLGTIHGVNVSRQVPPMNDKEQWRAKPEVSGGNVFTETDIHILDYMDSLFGEYKEFSYQCNDISGTSYKFDQINLSITYKNGTKLLGTWDYGSENSKDCVEIIGSDGILSFDFFHNTQPIRVITPNETSEYVIEDSIHVGLNMEQQIVNELNGTGSFSGTVDAAMRTLKIIDIIMS